MIANASLITADYSGMRIYQQAYKVAGEAEGGKKQRSKSSSRYLTPLDYDCWL